MSDRRAEVRRAQDVRSALHRLWTRAASLPDYVKQEWMTLQACIEGMNRRRRDRRRS